MSRATVEQFMTRTPHTIGQDGSLAAAHRLMREHGIRHLPVVEAGKLVGIVSQRDLHLIETLSFVDPEKVPVSDAMTEDVEVVEPTALLREVAAGMAEKKIGSVVVMKGAWVVGIFTTVDALRALAVLLDE